MRQLSRGAVLAIYAVLTATLIGVIVAIAVSKLDPNLVAAVSAVVPILVVLLAVAQQRASRRSAAAQVTDVAASLAAQVRSDWDAELPRRGLEAGRLITVRFMRTDGLQAPAGLAAVLPAEGTVEELIGIIGREAGSGARPRVVLTGEVGAGKTAACALLMVELASRQAGVPALFQLATWDPRVPLREWMTDQLPQVMPVLAEEDYGKDVVGLLADRHIIPILDGLDEMSEPRAALTSIDADLAGLPFVMTCRREEFRLANEGHVLHQAVVVELQPLRPGEVAEVLTAYGPDTEVLVKKLTGLRPGAVAQALSTPFMAALARDADAALANSIAAAKGAGAVESVRQQLLGTFVSRAYPRGSPIPPDRARQYLRFLATHADPAGRIAWWRLQRLVPRAAYFAIAAAVAALVCGGLAACFFALFARPWIGLWIGVGAGAAGAAAVEAVPHDDPRRARPSLRALGLPLRSDLARTAGFGLIGAASLAVIAFILYRPLGYTLAGALLSGFTFAVARYVSQPNDPLHVVTPLSLLRADRLAVLVSSLTGAAAGALTGFYLGYAFRDGHRHSYNHLTLLREPVLVQALLGAAGGAVLSAAGLGLMAMGSSSWGSFIWARIWLAGRGELPLRLMRFLADAHKRGVLRQVNGYYEFRHIMLQRYLADDSGAATDTSVGPDNAHPARAPRRPR